MSPRLSAFTATALSTPSASDPCVDSDFATLRRPAASTTTQSVNVPPMSTPIR